ncbi:hypothetical protein [Asticcacaulis sp. AND118]|uniref:hypothetical protein n=1 Tax=Asticcacaulis sp. AND118 TaxID=2840468 RepID=UPI001CFFB16D|nr:hypothetical protein [Asticcacaulis sp. AND118]UDF02376.1 hypothetical protein LH365_07935 [Asticcacaulis sp. AND118]
MKNRKIFGAAAIFAGALIAGQAAAECSDAQTIAIGKTAARESAEQLSKDAPIQKGKLIKVYDCDASGASVSAEFAYAFVSEGKMETVFGRIETQEGAVRDFDLGERAPLASNDETLVETRYGAFSLN